MTSPHPRHRLRPGLTVAALAVTLCLGMTSASGEIVTSDGDIERPETLHTALNALEAPAIEDPAWIEEEYLPEVRREVRVRIDSRGSTETEVEAFADLVEQILTDPRGWRRAGYEFTVVDQGRSDVTVVLASPSGVASFGFPCSAQYSCRSGDHVIINDDRWQGATDAWNEADGLLVDYRRMVLNHEMGHWLGHGHYHCDEPGEPAPLMQQQSKDLEGCEPNAWPLQFELDGVTR